MQSNLSFKMKGTEGTVWCKTSELLKIKEISKLFAIGDVMMNYGEKQMPKTYWKRWKNFSFAFSITTA